jgi:hypothetical protein
VAQYNESTDPDYQKTASSHIYNLTVWLQNRPMIPTYTLWNYYETRAHLHLAPANHELFKDAQRLHSQLNANYDLKYSSCPRIKARNARLACFGLGSTVGRFNRKLMRRNLQGQHFFYDIDRYTCPWFQHDTTRTCHTMFGDCYFPALAWGRYNDSVKACHDLKWFSRKYGEEVFYAAHLSWLLSDPIDVPPQPCLALHIRRGDACINTDRQCLPYDDYYHVTKFLLQLHPQINRMVVMTDGDDFPLTTFQSLIPNITYASDQDRSKYNVQHLANKSMESWVPEKRNLANGTSELLNEIKEASQCLAFIGTLTSGISKWILLHLIMRQGRIPIYWSLQGCLRNIFESGDYFEQGCEELPSLIDEDYSSRP